MKWLGLLMGYLFWPGMYCLAQPRTDSAASAGSTYFKINGFRSFFMGSNYRTEWMTPVKAPVIDLSAEHGGLTPVKRGGGKQTRSLRLQDPQGRQYTLRSIQKFITSKTLPGDLQSEAAADLVSDGVSASYPYAALSIPAIAEAAGIPHGHAKLVYIPDDPKLGEFRKDFANMLALYEERVPDSVEKAWDTNEVADRLKDDNDNDVDQQALLKIRILDMFVMDFDRHEDQWTWGSYDHGKGKMFFPLAKDRDQAFYINRGLLPGIIKAPWLVPQLEGFKPKVKNINRFNFAARNVDRFFLDELNEADWRNATKAFLSHMSDAVLEQALAQQPAEIRSISGESIVSVLKERRNNLEAEVMKYYRFLSKIVNITGSDKKELFDIAHHDDGSITVEVFKLNKDGELKLKMYSRTFDPLVTHEIRLYGFGGDDRFLVHGKKSPIHVRMIGGDGKDLFENTDPSANGGLVYDVSNAGNSITGKFRDRFSTDTAVNNFNRLGYKYDQTIAFISVSYNEDDGLFLGASLKMVRQGFRKTPYATMHQFSANHSLLTKAYNFHWYSEITDVFGKRSDLILDADIKAPDNVTNFFGYGIHSVYDKSKPNKFDYYRARYVLGDVALLMRSRISDQVAFSIGPVYEFYSLDASDNGNRFINQPLQNGLDPATLYHEQCFVGGRLMFTVDTRDNKISPRKGMMWQNTFRILSGKNSASHDLKQVSSDLSVFTKITKKLIWANRIGAGRNFGQFEFFQAQYLGAEDNLRGYRKNRFAGFGRLFVNTELRLKLADFHTYLFPASLGLVGFYDAGKIWASTGNNDKWVSGIGGGFWLSPLSRMIFTFTYAVSKEDKLPVLSLGWRF